MTTVQLLTFSFALWLGLYLIGRNWQDVRLRLAGFGLITYALALAFNLLVSFAPTAILSNRLQSWERPFLLLPSLCWLALLWHLRHNWRERLQTHPRPTAVILTTTLFFSLGIVLLFFPIATNLWFLSPFWLLVGIGIDLLLLGLAIAAMDAFDQGETLLPHFLRSLDYSFFTALLFGGQVALVMIFSTGITFPMLILLLTTLAAAITIQTFADPFQAFLDNIAFFNLPALRQTRADLREAATAVSRQPPVLNIETLDEAEFAKLTRRALAHMGNLPKLATSPLIHLPIVKNHLPDGQPNSLEQAAILKRLLTESIERLKPRHKGEFGFTDEWRHYNALYYPYVLGLKPYSRRENNGEHNTAVSQTLHWFRTQIPERTLHNWQNAAAHLVAQDLREQIPNLKPAT